MLCFCFGLIQPSTFSFLMCECEHELDTCSMHLTFRLFGGEQITTHNTIRNVMYAFVRESEHAIWKKQWYTFMLGISL
jgi:hypothetical protein